MIGHHAEREEIRGLPYQASLLIGPRGVGKWLAATEAAEGSAAMEAREDPSIDNVRSIIQWLQTRPLGGIKVGLFDLDVIGEAGQHAILKRLEEPPSHARLVCVSSRAVLPTIASRCHIIRFSTLATEEVADVLRSLGFSDGEATEMALFGGSVAEVLEAADLLTHRQDVLGYLSALDRRDRRAVWAYDEKWTRDHTRMLARWVIEARTGGPRVWKAADLEMARTLGSRMVLQLGREVFGATRFSAALVALDLWKA